VPALRGLRRRFPDHRITLVAPAALAPLARSSGAVDTVVDRAGLDVASLSAALPVALHGADVAVNLHGRGPQSSRLLAATSASARPDDLLLPAPPAAGPPAVVVHPGAASPARRWPVDRWTTVVRALVEDGHDVVLTGSAGERPLADRIRSAAGVPEGRCRVAAGTTDIAGLASLVASARLVLCGDTGVAHLATAYATPSVLLFGPVPPDRWGPVSGGPHRVLWAGHRGDPHGTEPDPGLLLLSTDDVLGAARAMLDAVGQSRGSTSSR
jgi:ADP-heptose:LPS heptosyltransferase